MNFDIINWSPNYLAALPFHLQFKNILLRAIEAARFEDDAILPQPQKVGVHSVFQKEYALKAYNLSVSEGKLHYVNVEGYYLRNDINCA